jgi:cyanophycin synthetase
MNDVKVLWTHHYLGPNPLSAEPVIVASLRSESLLQTDAIYDASRRVEALLGVETGGTSDHSTQDDPLAYFAARVVALTLASFVRADASFREAGACREGDTVILWLGYHNAAASRNGVMLVIKAILSVLQGSMTDQIVKSLQSMSRGSVGYQSDFQAEILINAAKRQNLPYFLAMPHRRTWQFGWGSQSLQFHESCSEEESFLGANIAKYKQQAKQLLAQLGAPVARHAMVRAPKELLPAFQQVGSPCVVKPQDRGLSRGVTTQIDDVQSLQRAYQEARKMSSQPIMLEAQISGEVHRLLVVRGRMVAACRRMPPRVIGDGLHTLDQLVERFNSQHVLDNPELGPAPLDDEYRATIAKQGFRHDQVIAEGVTVRVRAIPLLTTGAQHEDVTDQVHADTRRLVELVATTLGLAVTGFDFITPDIGRSVSEVGAFLEINLHPSLKAHLVSGVDVREVGRQVLGPTPKRIPTLLVVTDKDLDVEVITQLSEHAGVGWRTPERVAIGALKLQVDPIKMQGVMSALLMNKGVERMLWVCHPEEILRHGLPLDHFDSIVIDSGEASIGDELAWLSAYTDRTEIQPLNAQTIASFCG